jgi:hypothetical protein
MTRDRLATRKWKVRSDISESRSMMRSPSLSRSKSEVSRQSGHCSARLLAALRARKRHMQCSKTALLFDHVVCALLEKSSLPCSLDCAE